MVRSRVDKARAAVEKLRAAEARSRMARSRTEKVSAAVAKIRAFHELGRSLPPKTTPKDAYRQRIMVSEQERLGVNEDTLRKARAFADCESGYTPQELEELCRLIRDVQMLQDEDLAVFERSHLIRMLSVPRRKRTALQKECIRKGWSLARLEREIAKRFGTRRQGGRKRSMPHDLATFLVQTELLCEAWRRWAEELSPDADEVDERHILMADLPARLRKRIKAVTEEMWRLHQDVVEELRPLQPDREVRDVLQANAEGQRQRGRKG